MMQVISETAINHTLTEMLHDTLTFSQANGSRVAVRILPRRQPNGKLVMYESWNRTRPSRTSRLLTERGFEITFELPILFDYYLEQGGYPNEPQELIRRFFAAMDGEVFKFQSRELFR